MRALPAVFIQNYPSAASPPLSPAPVGPRRSDPRPAVGCPQALRPKAGWALRLLRSSHWSELQGSKCGFLRQETPLTALERLLRPPVAPVRTCCAFLGVGVLSGHPWEKQDFCCVRCQARSFHLTDVRSFSFNDAVSWVLAH